jgi:hypothetical protein
MDRLQARADIQDLNSFYALAVDTFRLEDAVNCWTVDGVFDERQSGLDRYQGHDQIRAFFKDTILANISAVVHFMANHLITDITETTAKGTVFTLVEVIKKDGVRSRVIAMYEDDYAKVDGAWKFRSRVIHTEFPREIVANGVERLSHATEAST